MTGFFWEAAQRPALRNLPVIPWELIEKRGRSSSKLRSTPQHSIQIDGS